MKDLISSTQVFSISTSGRGTHITAHSICRRLHHMTKKQSTGKVPAPPSHVLYDKLTPRESRVLAALGEDKKTDRTPLKK
jgi:hypothetical protein